MEPISTFKTKTGFCHILPDKIVLTREGVAGEGAKALVGNSIFRPLIIYSLLVTFILYNAYNSFLEKEYSFAVFFVAISIWLLYGIFSSLNNSATPVINRTDIQNVLFKKSIPGLTRSRFEIFFNENGRIKKRLIMLPGSLNGGPDATEKAVAIMTKENLLKQ